MRWDGLLLEFRFQYLDDFLCLFQLQVGTGGDLFDGQFQHALGRVAAAGFQGVDPEGDITTLGRGGSDTTAVALAAWLKADRCQIFTDVDGVYDRDPRIYSDATRFGQISYAKMMTLIENGAQVLHDRSVALAREYRIPVEVLSAFTGEPGTIVGDLESSYPIGT